MLVSYELLVPCSEAILWSVRRTHIPHRNLFPERPLRPAAPAYYYSRVASTIPHALRQSLSQNTFYPPPPLGRRRSQLTRRRPRSRVPSGPDLFRSRARWRPGRRYGGSSRTSSARCKSSSGRRRASRRRASTFWPGPRLDPTTRGTL